MQSSAIFLLLLGCLCTFAPQETAAYNGASSPAAVTLLIQAAGALYLGFAILNWMAKDNLIGGIYSRRVALGNLLHFASMAIALLKFVTAGDRKPVVLLVTIAYAIFATWFGLITFGSPVRKNVVLP